MKQNFFVTAITWFFILLLIYTGTSKLADILSVKDQLSFSPLPPLIATISAWALPIFELLLATVLFIPATRLKALYATAVLMVLFTVYVLVIMSIDNHISCGCGGIIEQLPPKFHLLFNITCVILCVAAILIDRFPTSNPGFNRLAGTSVICLFLVVGWTIASAFITPGKVRSGMEGSKLPAFNILLIDSTTNLNSAAIPAGEPFIIFRFEPWCPHCQAETREIIRNMQRFKSTRIYYIESSPFAEMKAFYQHYKLKKYPNIIMGKDIDNSFLHYYKGASVPYIAVFDAKKRLVTATPGKVDLEYLINALLD